MAGFGDLLGKNGVIEQLLLWNVVGQAISAMMNPAFTALQQDSMKAHPNQVLSPDVLANLVARHIATEAEAIADAERSGLDPNRFNLLLTASKVRLSPADLAEAVLRSYMTLDAAEAEAHPQGINPGQFKILSDLAGDAPGPQQLAEALRRGIIPRKGKGADSVSFDQGIAETRLHDKWAPIIAELSHMLLSPPDAASAVVRGFLPHDKGQHIAALSGVDAETFTTMVQLSGDAPGPQQLAEALRRGVIPYDSGSPDVPGFLQGIAEGRLADKWAPVIQSLAQVWPTPVAALEALLKGQLSEGDAIKLYERLGGDPEFFTVLFDTQGESPTPLELIDMANRGFIPWQGHGPDIVSYEQGFHEGRWKDKWSPVYKRFAEYLPAEGTILTLLVHGSITATQAAAWWKQHGMTDEQVKALLDDAHTEALSDYRGATVSVVLEAYHAQVITKDDATTILEALHVTPNAVGLLLAYVDVQRAFQAVNNAVTRVRTLFAARKITAATAQDALNRIGIPAQTIPGMMAAWEVENSITVRVLTEAQIVDAWEIGALSDTEAETELTNIGYTPFDAWVLMSIKAKTVLPNKPVPGPAAPQGQVIPGTT